MAVQPTSSDGTVYELRNCNQNFKPTTKHQKQYNFPRTSVFNLLNALAITGNNYASINLKIISNIRTSTPLVISETWIQLRLKLGLRNIKTTKKMAEKPAIKESLLMLNVCGLKPTNQNAWSLLRAAFAMVLCLGLTIEVLLEIVFNWRGLLSMEGVGILAALYQIVLKLIMMVVSSNKLVKLLKNINHFPALSTHGQEIKHKTEIVYSQMTKMIKLLFLFYALGLLSYFFIPYFVVSKTLPFDTYHPVDRNNSLGYQIMYFFQLLVLLYVSFGLLGFDFLFTSSILHLLCELKIIKQKLSNLKIDPDVDGDQEECLREVYQVIDHHNLVMKCIKRLEKTYSVLLLNQFLSSLVSICSALLSIIANGFPPDGLTLFKYVGYLGLGLLQLFSYCLAGAYLITETESVALAAYKSDWWVKTQPKLRKTLVLVIQRANREGKLTAGGMYILNLESFTGVVKNALSFFTIVQAMYTRTD